MRTLPTTEQVIWITGASSGIGRELALRLSAAGARLILTSRDTRALKELQKSCPNPENIALLPADLGADFDAASLVERAGRCFGQSVDVLFYAAGVSQRAAASALGQSAANQIMHVNFTAVQKITAALLPVMLKRRQESGGAGGGAIIALGSLAAHVSTPGRSVYSASKAALRAYFLSVHSELVHTPVRIRLYTIGFVRTNISLAALTADGTPHARMDDNQRTGVSVERCVTKILRTAGNISTTSQKRLEYFIALQVKGRIAYALSRIAPRVLARLIARKEGGAIDPEL